MTARAAQAFQEQNARPFDLYQFVGGWERKACSWDAPIARCSHPGGREAIDALPVIRLATPFPTASFPQRSEEYPQYFVALLGDGRRFLVDTEGAQYARYIVQLPPQ